MASPEEDYKIVEQSVIDHIAWLKKSGHVDEQTRNKIALEMSRKLDEYRKTHGIRE